MKKTAGEIMQRMFELLGYDPNKTTFYLSELKRDGDMRTVVKFINDWNPSVALLYLADYSCQALREDMVSIDEVLENPSCLDPWRELKALVGECKEYEDEFVSTMSGIIRSLGGVSLLGDEEALRKSALDAIEQVVKGLGKLRLEVWSSSSSPVKPVFNFCPEIKCFGSTSECILTLERSQDGLYVCHIDGDGLDGWFGFFVKSGQDIFSYDERTQEKYRGQWNHPRNDRYATDAREYDLFPYELVVPVTDENGNFVKTELSNPRLMDSVDASMRTCICMYLIAHKMVGQPLGDKPLLVDSMLNRNVKQLPSGSLVKYQGSSLMKRANDFMFHFDKNELLKGTYDLEFCDIASDINGNSQWLVDLYGSDFEYDESELLVTNASRLLIGDGKADKEFIADEDHMRLEAYYELRKKLADHIQKKWNKDFNDFGGGVGLNKWIAERLAERKDELFEVMRPHVIEACEDVEKELVANEERKPYNRLKPFQVYGRSTKVDGMRCLANKQNKFYGYEDCGDETPWTVKLKDDSTYQHASVKRWREGCMVAGSLACYRLTFQFDDIESFEKFLGAKAPKFCANWKKEEIPFQNGNPHLYVTDPVNFVKSPLKNWVFGFDVYLGKSGLNKLRK